MKEKAKAIWLWLRFIIKLIINYFKLNDDISNNNLICKNISTDIINSANINLRVIGKNNIENINTPFLLTSNHRSFFDIFLLITALDKAIPFVAAKKLYSYPILNKFIMSIGCIKVNTSITNTLELKQQLKQMTEHLKENSMILFPEGECNYLDKEIKKFKKGGFIAIENTETCIIPTYINIEEFAYIKRWCVPKGNVTVIFGEPFNPKLINDDKMNSAYLAEYAREKINKLKNNFVNN